MFHSSESPKNVGVSYESFMLGLTTVVLSEDQFAFSRPAHPAGLLALGFSVPSPGKAQLAHLSFL